MKAVDVFVKWLDDYLNFEKTPSKGIFWLDTMKYLCHRFKNPQNYYTTVHVAGSKGKGSVCRMIACILEEAGFKTGLYSSPHITDFRERICTPSGFFEESIYEEAIREMVPRIESIIPGTLPGNRPITWFELVTLYSFIVLKNAHVDYGVYEVGLGGRLDSTNIISPKVCCITPIELEHTEFLGDTLEKIAYEKAGIIKHNTPVVIAKQQNESVNQVFKDKCKEVGAPYYFVDDFIKNLDFKYVNNFMEVSFESHLFARPIKTRLNMIGDVQAQNAAMAAIAVKELYPMITEDIIEKGLSKAELPGRFERIEHLSSYPSLPLLILDGAHTVNSIRHIISTMEKLYSGKKINLLFACAADKDVEDMALLCKDKFNKIFITKPGIVKASNIEKACNAFNKAGIPFTSSEDYSHFILDAVKQSEDDNAILLVTGSFYLISEVKKALCIWK